MQPAVYRPRGQNIFVFAATSFINSGEWKSRSCRAPYFSSWPALSGASVPQKCTEIWVWQTGINVDTWPKCNCHNGRNITTTARLPRCSPIHIWRPNNVLCFLHVYIFVCVCVCVCVILNKKIHTLLSQVYCVWQVVKTPTVFSNIYIYIYIYIYTYRVIRKDCRGFNNLSYTIHLR